MAELGTDFTACQQVVCAYRMAQMRRVRFYSGFARALWLAARYDVRRSGWRVAGFHAWGFLKAIWGWIRAKKPSKEMVQRRLNACESCEIYCPELRTCGDVRLDDDKPLGCFCYMPVKARIKDSECWLKGEGIEPGAMGWPKEAYES
jgi:hypothetical protein